jgi:hypothetical protein
VTKASPALPVNKEAVAAMGMLGAFIVGYILGTRAGQDGIKNLRQAWSDISESQEVQALVATGVSLAGTTLTQLSERGKSSGTSERAMDPGVISLAVFRQIRERMA